MTDVPCFSGKIRLERIMAMRPDEFERRFPGVDGFDYRGEKLVGSPVGETPVWNEEKLCWERTILPVERVPFHLTRPELLRALYGEAWDYEAEIRRGIDPLTE